MIDAAALRVKRSKMISRQSPQRHRWVRQWRIAKGEPACLLIAETQSAIEQFEQTHYPRVRARRPEDRKSREDLVHAIVANLAHAVVTPPPTGRLAVRAGNPRKGSGRYNNPAFGKGVKPLLDQMHEMGLLDFKFPAAMRGEVSSIAPTESFAKRVKALGITADDFAIDERDELLVLTRKVGARAAQSTDRVEYTDTIETAAMRGEVRGLNAVLAKADIEFIADGMSPIIDPTERLLKRRFVLLKEDNEAAPRFDRGGRLFGGFWTNLASSRRGNIRIDGEPIADLDYSSMFARLAYAAIGEAAPDGDVYELTGLERGYRSGIKLAFNIFLFDSKRRREAWPNGEMGIGVGTDADAKANPNGPAARFEGLLPAGWENPERLRTAILGKHPALKAAFGRRLGYGLMFTESRVLLRVLKELMLTRGIVALPLHDGLMVARTRSAETAEVMREVALEMTGAAIPVEEKAGKGRPSPGA